MMANSVLVIDGGFATQLSVHVGAHVDGDPLWSARFNATDPAAVIETHLDFLKDGADAILTNTYQASVEGYMEYLNLDEQGSVDLIKKTVKLAHIARQRYLKEHQDLTVNQIPWIVGSIGPYGAHLHDGSEYTGSYAETVSADTLKKWHRTRIDAVIEAGVDALALETIPCRIEAEALLDIMYDEYPDVKFWISFQCKDGSSIAYGDSFSETVNSIWDTVKERRMDNFLAVGVNCLHPKYVTPLFKSVNGSRPKSERIPLVVYPNSGEVYEVENAEWTGSESCIPLECYVPDWITLNAKIIGGCCRTYSRDIRRIKTAVTDFKV